MDIFALLATSNTDRYIIPEIDESEVTKLKPFVSKGELQFIGHNPVTCSVSEQSGFEAADYIYNRGFHIFSERLKRFFDNEGIDNVFYKPMNIISEELGIDERYYITVVPRIDCLDIEKSVSEDERNWDTGFGMIPRLKFENLHIKNTSIGRYKMFRLLGIEDEKIYITDELCLSLKDESFLGLEYKNIYN